MTYQTQFLLTSYFAKKIINPNTEKDKKFFMCISPACLTVNVQYFLLLNKEKIYKLKFLSLIPHFVDSLFIIVELLSFKPLKMKYDALYHYVYIVFAIIFVMINRKLRGVWSYNLFDLTKSISGNYIR